MLLNHASRNHRKRPVIYLRRLRAHLSSSMVLLAISIFAAGCSRVHVHGVRSGASAEEVLGSLQSWHWCWPVSFRRVRSCP